LDRYSGIKSVISKLNQYRVILNTDRQRQNSPLKKFDIETFFGARIDFGHDIFLGKPPFNLDVEILLDSKFTPREDIYPRTVLLGID
jgi:hypothetical protein